MSPNVLQEPKKIVVLESIEVEENYEGDDIDESNFSDEGGWEVASEVEGEPETPAPNYDAVSQTDFTPDEVETIQNHLEKTVGPRLVNISL